MHAHPDTPLWIPDAVWPVLQELSHALKARAWSMATAESCTGGLIAAACTSLSGSSDWFERGFVTYSNAAKNGQLGVSAEIITRYGAVSEAVARAMAEGACAQSAAQVSVAVTGVAGPTGGSIEKPVGTVWFGWTVGTHSWAERRHFDGDRAAIRAATVEHALTQMLKYLEAA